MSGKELRGLLQATPFQPFSVCLADDKEFEVEHPEFVLLTPTGRTLILANKEDDGVKLLDVALITRVNVRESRKSGSRRKA